MMTLPLLVQDRIAEAGASLLRWRDEELLAHLDPQGRWRTASSLLRWSGISVVCAGLLAFGVADGAGTGAWTALVIVTGLALTRGRRVPWIGLLVLLLTVGPSGWDGLTVLAALIVYKLTLPAVRDGAFAILTMCALAAAQVGGWWTTPLLVLGVLLGVWWQKAVTGAVPNPFVMVRPVRVDQLPDPPTRLPWLVLHHPGAEDALGSQSREIRRKSVGAFGERATACLLLALPRWRGTRIAHDVALPHARDANIDHVVVHRGAVFVLDSKRFGTTADPGRVQWSEDGSDVAHVTSRTRVSLRKSAATVAWAADEVGDLLGAPVTPVIVVHNAEVPGHGIRMTAPSGRTVEVISADLLLSRLSGEPVRLGWWSAATVRWSLVRLRGAATGRSPRVVAPLGPPWGVKLPVWKPQLLHTSSGAVESGHPPSAAPAAGRDWPPAESLGSTGQAADRGDSPTRPLPVATPSARADASTSGVKSGSGNGQGVEEPAGSGSWARPRGGVEDPPPPLPRPTHGRHGRPVVSGVPHDDSESEYVNASRSAGPPPPEELLSEAVDATWAQMLASEPAAGDEIPEELRVLQPGMPVHIVEIGDEQSPGISAAVAVSGVCHSDTGPYVWVTSPTFWSVHERTSLPVTVVTRRADEIVVPPPAAGLAT